MNTETTKAPSVQFDPKVHGERLKALIKNASDLKFQQSVITEQIGDVRSLVKDELGIAPKVFNSLLAMYHKDQRDDIEEQTNEVFDLYDAIFAIAAGDNA